MYDMTRGVLPLKLLDLINHRYVQNANIYAANHDLGFQPVNRVSSIFRGKLIPPRQQQGIFNVPWQIHPT
jgi:hypothetical protein